MQLNGKVVEFPLPLNTPGALYFGPDDTLRITTYNAAGGAVVRITGRMLRPDGSIERFEERHEPASNRTAVSSTYEIGEGWLLNVTVVETTAGVALGATWAQLLVVRGRSGATQVTGELTAGMVNAAVRLSWPSTPSHPPTERPGRIRSVAGTNPAAGAEWSETVPTRARWRLLAVRAQLVTDATVSNRRAEFIVDDGTTSLLRVWSPTQQAAGATWNYVLSDFGVDVVVAGNVLVPMPGCGPVLNAGCRIRSSTTNLQAGDDWAAPQLLVEEWLEVG